jgi:hypothetical protein
MREPMTGFASEAGITKGGGNRYARFPSALSSRAGIGRCLWMLGI